MKGADGRTRMTTAEEGSGGGGENAIWGTWEELLLASAVSRHGTGSWDSVAMEFQSRIRDAHLYTAQDCRLRFLDLHRRFASDPVGGEASPAVPWLEDLRRLRVAKLRREVERYDVSIVSLELKLKRLKEEHKLKSSIKEGFRGALPLDLKVEVDDREEEAAADGSPPGSAPEILAGDRISGGRSCKESNSTDPKDGEAKLGVENAAGAGEDAAADPSIAESKEEEAGKEISSEAQSSSCLLRRRGPRGRRRKPPAPAICAWVGVGESLPLISLLEIIRSDASGSVFESRLDSQDSELYGLVIRRHMNLGTVKSKIEKLGMSYTRTEFRRDLLLLCANAVVYYPKGSDEFTAAVHLRRLISSEEFAEHFVDKETPPPPAASAESKDQTPPSIPAPVSSSPKSNTNPDLLSSLLEKSTSSTPMFACRKRSSISAKSGATAAATAAMKEEEEENEEKPPAIRKEVKIGDLTRSNMKSKLRSLLKEELILSSSDDLQHAARPGRGPDWKNSKTSRITSVVPKAAASLKEVLPKTTENSGSSGRALAKRRSAANFLNQLKRGSQDNKGTLLECLKNSRSNTGSGGKGRSSAVRQKKAAELKKAPAEPSMPVKRSVGRPPKKKAPPALPAPPPRAKRKRGGGAGGVAVLPPAPPPLGKRRRRK